MGLSDLLRNLVENSPTPTMPRSKSTPMKVVGTPKEGRTEEYGNPPSKDTLADEIEKEKIEEIDLTENEGKERMEPSLPDNWNHTVELLHGNPPSKDTPADEIEKEKIEEIDPTENERKEQSNKRTIRHRAQETLSELDRLIKQEYEVITSKQGTPDHIAKCTIMRYLDSAINNVLGRMSKDEKKTYWNNIVDANVTEKDTTYFRKTIIHKLAQHVTATKPANKKPKQGTQQTTERKAEHTASTSREKGTIDTLQKRNQLKQFHQNMMQLNKLWCSIVTGINEKN